MPPFSPAGQSSHSSVNPGPVPDVVRTSLQARKRCGEQKSLDEKKSFRFLNFRFLQYAD